MDDLNKRSASFLAHCDQTGYEKMTELEISSARFDQSPSTKSSVCRFVICSTQRSGSFLLCRQLINAGIGIPQEYFNPIHLDILRRRWELSTKDELGYIQELYAKRTTPNGVWGTKLQWLQYVSNKNAANNVLDNISHFLFLYRKDLVAQAVSLHVSLLTGVWGFDGTVTTEIESYSHLKDVHHVARCAKLIKQENEKWHNFFNHRRITPLVVCYEDFVADQPGSVKRIAQYLGLDDNAYRVSVPEVREDRMATEFKAVKQDLMKRCQSCEWEKGESRSLSAWVTMLTTFLRWKCARVVSRMKGKTGSKY